MKLLSVLVTSAFSLIACSSPAPEADIPVREQPNAETDNIVRVPITSDPAKAKLVHAYVKAYNVQDIDAMLALATPDVEWLSVDGADMQISAKGATKVREAMLPYFENCPSCRSNIRWTKTTEDRVVALEDAVWDDAGKRRVQSSLSLYEFEGDKIKRVYYFPVESKPGGE